MDAPHTDNIICMDLQHNGSLHRGLALRTTVQGDKKKAFMLPHSGAMNL